VAPPIASLGVLTRARVVITFDYALGPTTTVSTATVAASPKGMALATTMESDVER
jgi:hypothetical protein